MVKSETVLVRRTFQTAMGEVWLWGSQAAFAGSGAVVFVIHGAFADHEGRFFNLEQVAPVSVIGCKLPGLGCPALVTTSIGVFAVAYSEAVAAMFPKRQVIVCGESAGGLVALAMTAGDRRLALDPPLRTAKMWPSTDYFRNRLREDPTCADFLWSVLGVSADELVDRDYTHLLRRPARIVVGEQPLYPVRAFTTPPSVVDEPERRLMLSLPHIWLTVAEGAGHMIPSEAPALFTEVIRDLCGLD